MFSEFHDPDIEVLIRLLRNNIEVTEKAEFSLFYDKSRC